MLAQGKRKHLDGMGIVKTRMLIFDAVRKKILIYNKVIRENLGVVQLNRKCDQQ